MDKAEVAIRWNNTDGIDSVINISTKKKSRAAVTRIIIAQLDLLKHRLLKGLDDSETQEINVTKKRR